ncbi:MAG: ASCH domain-containing protein [Euryarchaeota archaeon]|nr:ASCH domain-containing protein [Euryarchaeota archaeon]
MSSKETATASVDQLFHIENAPIPSVGGPNIILRSNGESVCILRVTDIRVCKFCEVTAEHAYGESDRSLEY